MPHSPSILVYGREPHLLQSRSWVFEVGGFQVSCAETLQEAQQAVSERRFDLLVLCHTLSSPEFREALAWARTLPSTRRLVLVAGAAFSSDLANEAILSQFAGPRELVSAAKRVLASRTPAGAGGLVVERRETAQLAGAAHG